MKSLKNILLLIPMGVIGATIVYAAAPTGGYDPNATLNPDCAPADTDCFVKTIGKFIDGTNATDAVYVAGNVGIGTATPAGMLNISGANASMIVDRYSDSIASANLHLRSARGTDIAPAPRQLGDYVGTLNFQGYNGVNFTPVAQMAVSSSENHSSAGWGSDITFSTVKNGTGSLNERVRISNDGNVGIGTLTPEVSLHVMGKGVFDNGNGQGYLTITGTGNGGNHNATIRLNNNHDNDPATNLESSWMIQNGISPSNNSFGIRAYDNGIWRPNSFVIDVSSGNVGIGTDTPTEELQISKTQNSPTIAKIHNSLNDSAAYASLLLQTDHPSRSVYLSSYPASYAYSDFANSFVINNQSLNTGGVKIVTGTGGLDIRTSGLASGSKLNIDASGVVAISNLAGTHAGGSAFVCVDTAGNLYTSEVACP